MMRPQPSGKGNPFSWWPVVMSRACRGALEGGREGVRGTSGTARFSVDPDKVHRGQRRDGEPSQGNGQIQCGPR